MKEKGNKKHRNSKGRTGSDSYLTVEWHMTLGKSFQPLDLRLLTNKMGAMRIFNSQSRFSIKI